MDQDALLWTLVRLLPKACCPLVVKLSWLNAAAIHAAHPTKPNAKSLKPQADPIATVVQAVVVVTMERLSDAEASRQLVNGLKAMRV